MTVLTFFCAIVTFALLLYLVAALIKPEMFP